MDRFNELLNGILGDKAPANQPIEEQLKRARELEAKTKADIERLEAALKGKKEQQEIVLTYIPGENGSVKIVKGEEYSGEGNPENVVALAEAIAMILHKKEGASFHLMTAALLSTIANMLAITAGGISHDE